MTWAKRTPLSDFEPKMREKIEREASGSKPPPKEIIFRDEQGRALAAITNRAWCEWNVRHGRKPMGGGGAVAPYLRVAVLARDGMICQLCKLPIADGDLHIDHIKPRSRGGRDILSNLQAAHSLCNIHKSDKWDDGD